MSGCHRILKNLFQNSINFLRDVHLEQGKQRRDYEG